MMPVARPPRASESPPARADSRAVLRLRRIPHDGGGTQGEAGGNRKRRRGNTPERRPRPCCPGARAARVAGVQQPAGQCVAMPKLTRGCARQLKSTIFNRLRHLDILHCGSPNCLPPTDPGPLSGARQGRCATGVGRPPVGGNGAAPDVLQPVMERSGSSRLESAYGVAVPHARLSPRQSRCGCRTAPLPCLMKRWMVNRSGCSSCLRPESQRARCQTLSRISRLVRREPVRTRC